VAGGLTLRPPSAATHSRRRVWQPPAPWVQCDSMQHTPDSASGGRRVIAVALRQRAATGACGCNQYAATRTVGHGATMQLARRPCGTCARLGKWCAACECGHPGAACNHRRVGLQPLCSHRRIGSWRYDALDPPHSWYQSFFPDTDRQRPSQLKPCCQSRSSGVLSRPRLQVRCLIVSDVCRIPPRC
jgi:hypothetical protein